ncbi:MAG: LytTR family transcriptional regulator DNA-binding domain-containing protein [Prevotella sp.]|nr:LytTR family transcriptional regulator DNA-binding domain-containing protein [Prevotella sp.]
MKSKQTITRWVLGVGIWVLACLNAQAQMESHLTFRRYTTRDGLPQVQSERLWQDARGYIYIGTLSGFVRFDGRAFDPYLKGRRENIVGFTETDGQVTALGFRRQWVVDGCDVKMRPIDGDNHWQLNNLNADGLPRDMVLLEDEQETHRRLCRVRGQQFDEILADTLLDLMGMDRKLYADSQVVLIPTPQGLYSRQWGSGAAKKVADKPDVYTLLRTDSALLAFAADGIYAVESEGLRLLQAVSWSEASFGIIVRPLQSGRLVVADEHTVYLYDGATLRQVMTGINLVRDVLVDRWDRLWVATYQGVYCFFNRNFTNHTLTDRNDIVRAVAADAEDRLVMGTLNGKMMIDSVIVSDDPMQYYGTGAARVGRQVFLLANGDVTCVDDDGTARTLGLPPDRYKFLSEHNGRLLLVSQRCVISAYDPRSGQIDTLTTQIPYPWCVAADDEGCLWAGGTKGVYRLNREGQVTQADYPQSLVVTTMQADSRGTVFFASADSLFMIRHGQLTALNAQMPQLCSHEVRALHVSPRGYLVVAVVDGLFICRVGDDYALSDVHFFDHHNGFTMLEPLKATIAETSDGTVWIAGVEEMTSFRLDDVMAHHEEDTYVEPLPRWWQHWWVWLLALTAFVLAVWGVAFWYEKRRNRRKMIRLQREKLEQKRRIDTIRQKAIEAENTELAKDIVKMTEKASDERLTLRTASGTFVVDVTDIAYFKGDGNYSQIVTFHSTDTVLVGLGALEKTLAKETFVRADRSTLVNIHNISNLMPKQRRCVFRSPDGQEVETRLLAPAFKRLQDLL